MTDFGETIVDMKESLYKDTSHLVKAANEIYDRAYSDYSDMVSNAMAIMPTQKQVEHILDGMLDFMMMMIIKT